MEDQTKANLTNESIWVRLVYMVVLAIGYGVAEAVVLVVAIFQFFAALTTAQINRSLHKFSANLVVYVYQIIQFETFNTEKKPFPFSAWPDVAAGETAWLTPDDAEFEAETVAESEGTSPSNVAMTNDGRGPGQSDEAVSELDVSCDQAPRATDRGEDTSDQDKPV
jgi:hypothetical protein